LQARRLLSFGKESDKSKSEQKEEKAPRELRLLRRFAPHNDTKGVCGAKGQKSGLPRLITGSQ
jgi:hypothetical protein